MPEGVRLLSDDLTGALDAAVRLARVSGELPVMWNAELALRSEGPVALTSATRELSSAQAQHIVSGLMAFWRDDDLCFKKIDSLWRGNTVAEIATLADAGRFATILIASAFPGQQRMTRDGRHYHRASPEDAWLPVATDSIAEFAQYGVVVSPGRAGQSIMASRGGIWMFDAETDADLDSVVGCGRDAKAPILWCGSAGLAGALASQVTRAPPPHDLELPAVIIVGSLHPVSRRQVEDLVLAGSSVLIEVDANRDVWPKLIALAGEALHAGRSVVFWYSPHTHLPEDVSGRTMSAFFELLGCAIQPPGVVFVTGGETLQRLCEAVGATQLIPIREMSPGVPVSRVVGGQWAGRSLISKSGAFGDRDLIVRMLSMLEGQRR